MSIRILVAATLALVPLSSPAQSEWVDIKDVKELSALFSNKTHRSRAYVAHYRTDGAGILQMSGSEVRNKRVWEVKGDQVCVGAKGEAPMCFRYQRSAKNPAEILGHGERGAYREMHWFTVEDGIPKF